MCMYENQTCDHDRHHHVSICRMCGNSLYLTSNEKVLTKCVSSELCTRLGTYNSPNTPTISKMKMEVKYYSPTIADGKTFVAVFCVL